jgi:hypothetical protein
MIMASLFGAATVIFAGITIVILVRWRRWRDAQPPGPKGISAEM